MRTLATLATTITLLLFLAASPAFTQDREESRPEAKPSQQENREKKDQEKGKVQEEKAPKPDKAAKQDDRKPEKNDSRNRDDNRMPEGSQPQERHSAQDMDRGHEQHQATRGKRIPDDKFRSSFGRQHAFHVRREQVVNVAQPVVVYGGYSFQLVDAWPVDWGFDDDVYVDYVDDGYYLFNPLHPGFRITVFVAE